MYSFDKQFIRDYLTGLPTFVDIKAKGCGVELPQNIVDKTLEKYIEAYETLTGEKFI